jgi:hypothetical protein
MHPQYRFCVSVSQDRAYSVVKLRATELDDCRVQQVSNGQEGRDTPRRATMKKTLISALALTIALGAGTAFARGNSEMGPRTLPSFEELDRDGNGQITQEELKAFGDARRAEMEAKRAERIGDCGQRMFDRVDANDDSVIDAQEYAAFTDRVAERMERRGMGHGDRH